MWCSAALRSVAAQEARRRDRLSAVAPASLAAVQLEIRRIQRQIRPWTIHNCIQTTDASKTNDYSGRRVISAIDMDENTR